MLLVDTNVWLAAADRRSRHHAECARLIETHRAELASTVPVISETAWLLLDRDGPAAQQNFVGSVATGEIGVMDGLPRTASATTIEPAMSPHVSGGGSGTNGTSGITLSPMTIATIARVTRTSPPRFTSTFTSATVTAEKRQSATGRSVDDMNVRLGRF